MKSQLLALLKKDAFFKKKVMLSSGKESDYYIDVRRVSLTSQGLFLISSLLWERIRRDNCAVIGGPTLGADPIVGGICVCAYQSGKNMHAFLIRKTPKKHGQQKMIEGKELSPGTKAVILDDVATSGGSLIHSLNVLKEHDIEVSRAYTVIDRQEGAAEALASHGCPLDALFTPADFL
ncbi:MAG: orotate phosphoribosyltransferase [Candidatus Omnitrophica bacterium]|nr:orotate phosphoribosyltransferase [Candidatus Omnitrophota bacterium]